MKMPARTNEFQKLVKVINHSLAPSDAKITESAMLFDPEAEYDREIDILIESNLLNCNIKIGIECTATSRPLDVRTIESFKEKHRKVGIHQTVVVSKNGYSSPAKNYAKKHNIKLLTFNNAKKENWSKQYERLKNLSMYARKYTLKYISLTIPEQSGGDFVFDNLVTVFDKGVPIPVNKFAVDAFQSSEVSKKAPKELMDNELGGSEQPWVEVGFVLNKQYVFRDKSGVEVRPQDMIVVMNYKSNYHDLESKQVDYDGSDLVIGSTIDEETKESLASVAINEIDGKLIAKLGVSPEIFPVIEK